MKHALSTQPFCNFSDSGMKPSQFEYDPRKAAINLRKHGVSFDEAITVFADPLRSVAVDTQHSWEEERFLVVGQSTRGRVLFIVLH